MVEQLFGPNEVKGRWVMECEKLYSSYVADEYAKEHTKAAYYKVENGVDDRSWRVIRKTRTRVVR